MLIFINLYKKYTAETNLHLFVEMKTFIFDDAKQERKFLKYQISYDKRTFKISYSRKGVIYSQTNIIMYPKRQ